ncbi:hypothetical protein BJF93_17355 [Xaviernesmea oryzae]|uniref:Uncharacterized protein n=1 Tax=Xaviernesmea oryzae TaxID=464029 RepID=A0A1Q9ATF4_9HYPH|nr:hypothetical protein [Xaviernesmea oryzae]OLP58611.1 hypothetical protein BJF93_17355 [Xaviernesmea oryzae]SEK64104.1 hypothetical protein SAMN04487976_103177 [Xaviernesmea oryzae]
MPGLNAVYEVLTFALDHRGHPVATGAPLQVDSEDAALALATRLKADHAGVAAIRRPVRAAIGETGPIEILFQAGRLGDFA